MMLQDFGSELSIEAYMQLPVEQYYELDPAMIRPLGSNRFALQVPRVHVSVRSLHSAFISMIGLQKLICDVDATRPELTHRIVCCSYSMYG